MDAETPDLAVTAPDHVQTLADDGSWTSRKLWLTVFTMVLIMGGGLGAGLAANLPTVVGGLLGALGLFHGGNVATKFAAAGVAKAKAQTPTAG